MDFQEFCQKQGGIYNAFLDQNDVATREGSKPDPVLVRQQGGYTIFLRPDPQVVEIVEALSLKACTAVPGMSPYSRKNIHTTLITLGVADYHDPRFKDGFQGTMSSLESIVHNVAKGVRSFGELGCSYDLGFVFNLTTLILQGKPTEAFFKVAQALQVEGRKHGLELRLPWGAHITSGRFYRNNTPDEMRLLDDLCKEANESLTAVTYPCTRIVYGYFTVSGGHFHLYEIGSALL